MVSRKALLKNATNEMTFQTRHFCHHRLLNVKVNKISKPKEKSQKLIIRLLHSRDSTSVISEMKVGEKPLRT